MAVLCFNAGYILFDNLEFDSIEIVDNIDSESNSENEVEEKIEFEDEIIKIHLDYHLVIHNIRQALLLKGDEKIQSGTKKIVVPPPRYLG